MSEVSSAYSSTSRVTGLYSNMDTDKMVEDLMKIQQTKVDAKLQDKTTYQWHNESLDNVTELVKTFQNTYLSALGSASMLKSATYNSFTVDGGDSTAATITAGSSAITCSMTVNSITQLAKNAGVSSSSKVSADGTSISESNLTKLGKLSFANKLTFDQNNEISFSINGKSFSFSSGDSLQTMINTVNADEEAGVTMKYSRLTDTFTVTADSGGASSAVEIKNISGNAFGTDSAFGIAEGTTKTAGYGEQGQDAIVTIENVAVTKQSNTFSIDGINYTLNATTDQAIDFTVKRDVSTTVDAVKTFVDAYNTLMEKLGQLYREEDVSADYPPLTDAQKEDMSEDQIKSWEEKAKSGLLRNNRDMSSFLSQAKQSFFSLVGGSGKIMASVGITTAGYFSTDFGKIMVDEERLTAALEENGEQVVAMFTSSEKTPGNAGLIYKITDSVNAYLKKVNEDIDRTEDKIGTMETRIDDMTDKMDDMARSYYNRFAIMEEALGRLNSQSNMLSSLMAP